MFLQQKKEEGTLTFYGWEKKKYFTFTIVTTSLMYNIKGKKQQSNSSVTF